MAEKEVAKREEPKLPAIPDPQELKEVFAETLEGIQPSFEQIKIPTAGGLVWTIPGDEEPQVKKELVGVIVDHYPFRIKFPRPYGEGVGDPPECTSLGAVIGSRAREDGDRYGVCATCCFAKFGTGRDGRGQACRYVHRVFVLLAGSESIIPYLISFPPTSAPDKGRGYEGSLPTYLTKIGGKGKKSSQVWTKFKLTHDEARHYTSRDDSGKEKTVGGETYSKVLCFEAGSLNAEEKKIVAFLKDNLKAAMRDRPFEATEYEAPQSKSEVHDDGDQERHSGEVDPWEKEL